MLFSAKGRAISMSTILTLLNSMKLSVYPPFPMFPFNLLFSVIVFALLLPHSVCVDPQWEACQNQTCGSTLPLPFPFRKSGCGLRDFEIVCDNLGPELQIDSTNYTVYNFVADNRSFTMASENSLQNCQPSSDANPTSSDSSNKIFDIIDKIVMTVYKCVSVCTFSPICPAAPMTENVSIELWTVSWKLSEDVQRCQACENNSGFCGYNSTDLICLYENGNQSYLNSTGKTEKHESGAIIGGSVGGVLGLALLFILCICFHQKKKKKEKKSHPFPEESNLIVKDVKNSYSIDIEAGVQARIGNLPIFSYEILKQATNNFDDNNRLGDGGFGTVYLGNLPDGRTVAVKRMFQDNNRKVEQFINEIEILSSLHHPNLVRLYGCTSPDGSDLLLVYEYVPNGTVADHLHGEKKGKGLNWDIRLKISLETAQALAFLHSQEPPVLHRDVKTTNVLLDENFKVKVADFGLSRFMPPDVTHVSTAPQGTPGYVDPEYYQCFQLTEKSDVYSFGVVLVEIMSGKLAVDINRSRNEIALANMAITKIKDGALHELVDASLGYDSDDKIKAAVTAVSELAFSCLQSMKDDRPSTKEIVAELDQIQKNWRNSGKDKEFNGMPPPSPTSVQDRWSSTVTTPNNSG